MSIDRPAARRFIDLQTTLDLTDIVELIGRDVALKRCGQRQKGLCPFHTERTPSFFVFPQTQSFHCFGCGIGGNAVSYLMQMKGLEFYDALCELAGESYFAELPTKSHKARPVPINTTVTATIDALQNTLQDGLLDERSMAKSKRSDLFTFIDRTGLFTDAIEIADRLAIAWNYCSHRSQSELVSNPDALRRVKNEATHLAEVIRFGRDVGILGVLEQDQLAVALGRLIEALDGWKGTDHVSD